VILPQEDLKRLSQEDLKRLARDTVAPRLLAYLAEHPQRRERGAVGLLTLTAAMVEGQLRQGTMDWTGLGPDAPENLLLIRCVVEQLWAEARRLRAAEGG
jgi:hypothetical protein